MADLGQNRVCKKTKPFHCQLHFNPGLIDQHRFAPAAHIEDLAGTLVERKVYQVHRLTSFQAQHATAELDLVQRSDVINPHFHETAAMGGIATIIETSLAPFFAHSVDEQSVDMPGLRIRYAGH